MHTLMTKYFLYEISIDGSTYLSSVVMIHYYYIIIYYYYYVILYLCIVHGDWRLISTCMSLIKKDMKDVNSD